MAPDNQLPSGSVESILSRAAELRHAIHINPEIALEEHETRSRIRAFLGDNFRYRDPLLGTDLIAEIPGQDDEGCIAIRADMDALLIQESTGLPWSSGISGKMHACGHDGHMAIAAATARMLSDRNLVPPVTVRFIFQPGEEVVAAGRDLAAKGAYTGARAAYALHGWPGVPLGSIALKEGPYFGASHHFHAVFRGRGTHGAYPERGINPLPAASRAVLDLQELHETISRERGEVVSACSLNSGSAANVIPGESHLLGTVRFLEAGRGDILENTVRHILQTSVEGTGLTLDLDYDRAYEVPLVNSPAACDAIRRAAEESGGSRIPVIEENTVERGSEDFAFALKKVSGALFKLGLGNDVAPLHSDMFDFPDRALETGIRMMGRLAVRTPSVSVVNPFLDPASKVRPYTFPNRLPSFTRQRKT